GDRDHALDWNSWMARPSHLPEHLHPTYWTATEGIDPATLAADDARALTAFRKALQDRAEGKHEDRFRRDDD
ncbi:MAG: hypothetical protein HYU27_09590, partial [Acidobacteria bacterium]|nr:hypothetical protein [Acidobacteriota bacterium]